jgi:hypothetical protein
MIEEMCGEELTVLDFCGGHANPYHYHERMTCLYEADPQTGHSTRIGTALDGRGLYGANIDGGRSPTDLDVCGGYPALTEFFHALCSTLPAGETFFIISVLHYAPVIKAKHPKLFADVDKFFKQEAAHTFVHEKWNERIEAEFCATAPKPSQSQNLITWHTTASDFFTRLLFPKK